MRYRNISGHPEDLADGRIVGIGEFVELTAEQAKDPFNKDKIDEGHLVEAPVQKSKDDDSSSGKR